MVVQVLHGPSLAPAKQVLGLKRRPCTWAITARMQPKTVDDLERLARQNGCTRGDIVRTAVAEFLEKHADTTAAHTVTDPTPPQNVPQPRLATPYRGSGGSDQATLKASATRQEARKQQGKQGERLMDKSVVR